MLEKKYRFTVTCIPKSFGTVRLNWVTLTVTELYPYRNSGGINYEQKKAKSN